ncbi:MAG: hypothetical protein ACREOC_06570 [Gemmatimonadales bacterium]
MSESTPSSGGPTTARGPMLRRAFLGLTLLTAVAAPGVAQDGEPFNADCTPLFTPQQHSIDSDCGIEGAGTTAAKRLESRAKNNFCATGAPVRLTFFSFDRLHAATKAADFDLGASREGVRGDVLTTSDGNPVGEGDVVMIAGFVIRADVANRSNGEAVNCNRGGALRNDVHIHVAPTPSKARANFCQAVIAEMSPHLRPDFWTGGDLMLADGIPIRITGHLFYDGSHPDTSCPPSASQKARARASAWEIHPVYRVDVCRFTTLQTCDPRNEPRWQPLEEWLNEHEDESHDE